MGNLSGRQLKKLREAHGPTLEKFAQRLGVSFATLSRNEQRREITTEMQKVINKWRGQQ